MLCDYGCGQEAKYPPQKGKFSKWCCSDSVNKCPEKRKRDSLLKRGRCPKWKNGHPKGQLGKKSFFKGKTFQAIYGSEKSNEIKRNISVSLKSTHPTGKGKTEEIERERVRKIKEKSSNYGGYRRGSGIGKKGWYKDFWCDSSWELAFVVYHLEHNIAFERNTKKFEYLWDGKLYGYIPDFIYPDGTYIEVKSFICEKTLEKIKQFPHKLIVLMEKEMKERFSYVIEKYGKDCIKLYEGKGGRAV